MIRSACATTAVVAVSLAFGASGALAAPVQKTPLEKIAAHDRVSLPSSLTHAIANKLGLAADAVAAAANRAPSQQELQAGDGMPLDLFGITVSLSGDGHTALVGAPGRTVGAAYVFVQHGGQWSEQQELQSPAGDATDSYGTSVTLAGDGGTALVGAYTGGDSQQGIVYSYTRQGGKYVLNGEFSAPDGAYGDEFGASVSLSGLGNVALIGAPDHNGYQGAAYVFVFRAGSWSEQREYVDPVAPGEAYGYSVAEAADGLTGVVGAPFANGGQGAAYAFSELGSSQQTLVGPATAQPFLFGLSVSIDALGGRILVGSPSANLGDGAAFVFDQGRGGWAQTQELVQSDPSGADLFGYSVALDYLGNVALIGSPERGGTAGSAFTFAGAGTLTQQRELTDPPAVEGDEYGLAVSVDALGDRLLVGAPYTNDAQGAAWASSNPIG